MIRLATPQDINRIVDIWMEASLLAHHFIPASYWKENEGAMRSIYIPSCDTYVYEDEESQEVIGFLSMKETYLAALFVAPAMQGKGVGKKLMDYAKQLSSQITLCVYSKNIRSVNFYKKEGFTPVKERIETNTNEKEWVMTYAYLSSLS